LDIKYFGINSLNALQKKLSGTFAPNKIMKGATESTNGESGLVPPPSIEDQKKCLLGNGTYGYPNIGTITISDNNTYEALEQEV